MASTKPPLQKEPRSFPHPLSLEEKTVMDNEIQELLRKGAIETVRNQQSPGFYSRLFTIPKRTGGYRPILDLSPLNKHLKHVAFRMDSADTIRRAVLLGDWAVSLDLRDAFFHVDIFPRDRKWLRFSWRDCSYQYKVLPFGLSQSPWVFTRVVRDLFTAEPKVSDYTHT